MQVVANLLTTTFDPWARNPLGSGITRLVFFSRQPPPSTATSQGGKKAALRELSIANLSTPILFSIPATQSSLSSEVAADKRETLCGFWVPSTKIYRRGAGLPSRL